MRGVKALVVILSLMVLVVTSVMMQSADDTIIAFDLNAETDRYVTGHPDLIIRIWDAATDQVLHTIQAPDLRRSPSERFSVSQVVFSQSGNKIAVSFNGTLARGLILVIDTATGQIFNEILTDAPVNTVDWSPNEEQVAGIYVFYPSTKPFSYLAVWDVASGEVLNKHQIGDTSSRGLDWHPSENKLAYSRLKDIVVWDTEEWRELYSSEADEVGAISVAWSPDGEELASSGEGGMIRIWDGSTGTLNNEIAINSASDILYPQVFWAANDEFVGVSFRTQVQVFDVSTEALTFSEVASERVTRVVIQPDGNALIATDEVSVVDTALPAVSLD